MKDVSEEVCESGRPEVSAEVAVKRALRVLYKDRSRSVMEEVVHDLTFEELIGTLLLARDAIDELRDQQSEQD